MYKGIKPCPICKKTGKEQPRLTKDGVCNSCLNAYKRGIKIIEDEGIEYELIRLHLYSYKNDFTNKLAHTILQSLHKDYVTSAPVVVRLNGYHGDNDKSYFVFKGTSEKLQPLLLEFDKMISKYEEQIDNIPKKVEMLAEKKYNEIYNLGIKEGRNLLKQLNQGKITIDELNNVHFINISDK